MWEKVRESFNLEKIHSQISKDDIQKYFGKEKQLDDINHISAINKYKDFLLD